MAAIGFHRPIQRQRMAWRFRRRSMEYMEYKGNRFRIEPADSWYRKDSEYRISVEEISSRHVWMPASYKGKPVTEWQENRFERRQFDKAKILYISPSLNRIQINNYIFPELEKVEVDPSNSEFFSDDRLIITQKNRELLYCPVCKGAYIKIPDSVREIQEDAFCGTKYQEIKFYGKETRIAKHAFRGSACQKLCKGKREHTGQYASCHTAADPLSL